jgi:hypothetical protein
MRQSDTAARDGLSRGAGRSPLRALMADMCNKWGSTLSGCRWEGALNRRVSWAVALSSQGCGGAVAMVTDR